MPNQDDRKHYIRIDFAAGHPHATGIHYENVNLMQLASTVNALITKLEAEKEKHENLLAHLGTINAQFLHSEKFKDRDTALQWATDFEWRAYEEMDENRFNEHIDHMASSLKREFKMTRAAHMATKKADEDEKD